MNVLRSLFIRQLLGAALAGLVPVVLVAFLSIPYSLGRHPDERGPVAASGTRHMT